jgi:hypothetical protein
MQLKTPVKREDRGGEEMSKEDRINKSFTRGINHDWSLYKKRW